MISSAAPLLLASRSPRRRHMLEQLRIPLILTSSHADESVQAGESPGEYLARVVEEKLQYARKAALEPPAVSAALVADTIVVVDEEILGKPEDDVEAASMLRRLVGRSHHVMSRYAFCYGDGAGEPLQHKCDRTVVSEVSMRQLSRDEIARYVGSGEGRDKAGAYAVQGLASYFVARIAGSYTNIVGLPLSELIADLQRCGRLGSVPM